ncbi:GPI ethanolamine phosphate transferase 1 [Psilocybe cubensis]|uniref:GPI ethanolamine phosphate transferase 1 n=1 Tax=Psilocybe cubensis TaxID=181762 RepID=A0ACB8H313_PSICU|nr:GPI ethanolamine phosphate transferase 1 [Psilocybe cubensis]KAH9482188.1 GPI ethanolamine phosphate transferase 1 [Psilocybe cubensis]
MTPKVSPAYTPGSPNYNVAKLLLIGLAFHLVYIGSVFDCYFKSPVVNGMNNYGYQTSAAAKRLVLIVGDGLRADLLFSLNAFRDIAESPKVVAPYLRSIAETRGAFGISHTRVPTESRPGHVAIIGKFIRSGMYEDVSAVTKGWKTNPVDFDSVFNQSSSTYSFGSPDILPMFAKGATPGKVKAWSYDEEEEDFTKDATALDIWVLDQMKILFANATANSSLSSELHSDKIVFFLHLLGLDTTGHSYRPHSKEYMKNIQVVDSIVRETEKLVNDFYGDEDTAFIFTADHGMSVIGNHGDGHPDNTRTPLIAWGRGIRGPLPDSKISSHDVYSKPWNLGHLFRRDVEQADIAALMAALLGINWPVNSVGVLPDVDAQSPGYLNPSILGEEAIARTALTNAKPLSNVTTTEDTPQIFNINLLIAEKQWDAARRASFDLIQQSLLGLHYLQTYDRLMIRAFVTAAYLGWAAYASLFLFRPLDYTTSVLKPSNQDIRKALNAGSWTILAAFWLSFSVQRSPWSFYVYITFPCYFWNQFLSQVVTTSGILINFNWRKGALVLVNSSLVVVALFGMVVGYTHRSVWSIGFGILGLAWPLSWNPDVRAAHWRSLTFWTVSCLATSVFPLLSVDKSESLVTIMIGGSAVIMTGSFATWQILLSVKEQKTRKSLLRIFFNNKVILVCITMSITASSVRELQAKRGLPFLNQSAGWIILVTSSVFPFMVRTKVHTKYSKILMYFLGFGPCFVILSISVEGLFFVAYSAVLVAWIQVEKAVRLSHSGHADSISANSKGQDASKDRTGKTNLAQAAVAHKFQMDDLRIALFFLFFVQVGFFGTGKLCILRSFYLAPVYRLIPIFNPFYMSSLLVFKIIAPYIMLSVSFAVLNDSLNLPPFSLLLVALTITDG